MKKILFALGLLFLFATPSWASTCTWSQTSGALASTAANWINCGGVAPTTGDTVIYDATSAVNSTWDITASIASINTTGYTGTVTASANFTVTGGITFANSTFAHGNQTVTLNGTQTVNAGTAGNSFYALTINGVTITLSSDLTVDNTLTFSNGSAVATVNGNNINAKGNVTTADATGFGITGTTALKINGTGNQSLTFDCDGGTVANSFALPITIISTGGTVTFTNVVHTISGNLTYTSGTMAMGTSTLQFFGTQTLSTGAWILLAVTFKDGSYTLSTDMDVDGVLTFNQNGAVITLNGNNIYASSTVTVTGSTAFAVTGTTVLQLNGTGTVTLFGDIGTGNHFNMPVVINTAGTVTFANVTHNMSGAFTYTAGTVATGTSVIDRRGTANHNSGTIAWYQWKVGGGTTTLTGNLSSSNTLTVAGTLVASSYTITAGQNFINTGTFTSNTSTLTFSGATTHTIDGTTTFNNLTCPTGETCSFDDADIFTISGTGSGDGTWQSDHATNTVDIDFTAETIASGAGTRVDSAGGVYVSTSGTVTDCVNWGGVQITTAYTWVG